MALVVRSIESLDGLAPHVPLKTIVETDTLVADVTGIPLLSDRGPLGQEIDFSYRECPYKNSPSRYPDGQPHEVPMSELERRRLGESYPDIRRLLLAVREAKMGNVDPETEMSVSSALSILGLMQYLPRYLVNRAQKPVDPESLPVRLVTASNSASGSIAAIGAFARGRVFQRLPQGEVLLAGAEAQGAMVGKKSVCVASPRMIVHFLDTLRAGDPKLSHGTVEEETGGLLRQDEVPRATTFGDLQETVGPVLGELNGVDRTVVEPLRKFNPKKHNARKIRGPLGELEAQLRHTVSALGQISASSNLMLGRSPEIGDEFEAAISGNMFSLKSLPIARQKGLTLNP